MNHLKSGLWSCTHLMILQRHFPWTHWLSLKKNKKKTPIWFEIWKCKVLWSIWSQLYVFYSFESQFSNRITMLSRTEQNRTLKRSVKAPGESEGCTMVQNRKLNYWLAEIQNILVNVLCVWKKCPTVHTERQCFFLDKRRPQFSIAYLSMNAHKKSLHSKAISQLHSKKQGCVVKQVNCWCSTTIRRNIRPQTGL